MSILNVTNVSKFYGPDEIFSGITAEVPHGARVALVGPNGAGKTTLLNLIVALDTPTEGTITMARGTRLGFLPQRPEMVGNHTLWEEQLNAFRELREMEAELSRLEHDMADPKTYDAALAAYGPLQEQFELAGGYTYESRMRMVLQGVGFVPEEYHKPLPTLSGGQKTRALLARLLLEEPDLLVMDEPTNHLDIYAVEWLEKYLRDFPGAVLIVSHDRYFMDTFASTIWELEFGTVEVYRGNYSHYLRQRDERHERHIKEYEQQQEFIAKEQEFIRKHMGSRLTAQAKGRMKKLATMKKRGLIVSRPRGERKEMNLRLQAAMRSGDKVLMTYDLRVGYHDDGQTLFEVPDITLYRGETAALIGPNGVGKSTFLKTVIGQLAPLSGRTELGASVQVGYFAQAHEKLQDQNTLIDELTSVKPMPISEARNILGAYLFSGEDVFRTVDTLSGGERGRLALAKLALSGANLLLLDEPTNHLDIDSQEVLQEVLAEFTGTILLVSHDRYIIDALATQIWEANPGTLQVFKGTYREYLEERARREAGQAAAAASTNGKSAAKKDETPAAKKHGLNPFQLKKRLTEVEEHIHALETRLEELTEAIHNASAAGDADKVSALGAAYTATEHTLEETMAEWEMLME
ncbi:MAG: ABC-F family ATP-binding cassette domain-containing protein [Anaerolineae bacterium]